MSYHKKLGLVLTGVFLILVLTGALCSKKEKPSEEPIPSELFPYVEEKKPTTPSVSPSQKPSEDFTTPGTLSKEELLRQAKIGKTTSFRYSRFGIQGLAQIISPTQITIQNFNYVEGCSTRLIFYLTRASSPNQVLSNLASLPNQRQTDASFNLAIPGTLDLLDFDSLAISCSGQPQPLVVANF